MSAIPPVPPTTSAEPDLREAVRELADHKVSLKALKLRGLLVTVATTSITLTLLWGAVQSIFLAIQVQRIDPAGQVGSLALIIGVGAIAAMIAAPIVGTLTDRTRSRIGGRAPWMLVGAVATLVLTILFSFATSIAELTIYWALLQISTNFILTPISAFIPDRVPVLRRGFFSSVLGLSQLAGNVIGQSVGAAFAGSMAIGYPVVGGLLFLGVITFVLVNRRSNLGEPRPDFNLVALLRTFWVNPVKHPEFAWAFFGRFLLMVGYFPLQAYTLYILQDYIGLGDAAVATVPALGMATLVGTIIGTSLAGVIADKIKATKPVIFACSALMVVSFAIPFFAPSVTSMLIYAAISGAGFGAYLAVDYVLVTQVLPSAEETGKDLGIINITTTLPQTIGVAFGGIIVSSFGGYAALFPVAAVFVILGALLLFFIRSVR